MPRNVGGLDRSIRAVVGVLVLGWVFFADMEIGWRAGAFIIGVAVLSTALFRYCPANAALGADTREERSALR
jgi:hypothetical protein